MAEPADQDNIVLEVMGTSEQDKEESSSCSCLCSDYTDPSSESGHHLLSPGVVGTPRSSARSNGSLRSVTTSSAEGPQPRPTTGISSRLGMLRASKFLKTVPAQLSHTHEYLDVILVSNWDAGKPELEEERSLFHRGLKYYGQDLEEVNRRLERGEEVEPVMRISNFRSG